MPIGTRFTGISANALINSRLSVKVLGAITLVLAIALGSGCANRQGSSGAVIIDTQGVDMVAYQRDYADCQGYAGQVSTGQRAAGQSVGGAVVGGAVGAIAGNSSTAQRGAGIGGLLGLFRGASSGQQEKRRVLRNCLIGRGYRVLN